MSAEATSPRTNYLNAEYGVRSWLFTRDHKRIALLYLGTITIFFALGGLMAALIRLELATPAGDLLQPDTYNRVFTMHGVLMIFLFLIPGIPAVLGNFLIPIMIGAKDLAFPKLNLASWYIFTAGALFILWSLLNGGVDTGWTFYTPYSHELLQHPRHRHRPGRLHHRLLLDPHRAQLHRHHPPHARPGTDLVPPAALRLGALRDQSDHQVLGTPVIAITVLMVALERLFHLGIFDPAYGGDPVLFQHLFWFYSHPAVYIMVLPAMGVISRDHRRLRPQADLRLSLRRLLQRWRSPCSASWSGATTCSSPAARSTPRRCSRCSRCWSRCRRRSRCSTGRRRSTRARSRGTRRCSTGSASSASSPSAA